MAVMLLFCFWPLSSSDAVLCGHQTNALDGRLLPQQMSLFFCGDECTSEGWKIVASLPPPPRLAPPPPYKMPKSQVPKRTLPLTHIPDATIKNTQQKHQVAIGADSKAVKRVLDGVSKVAPGLSFMGFSAQGPGASGKLLVFNTVAGAAAEVSRLLQCRRRPALLVLLLLRSLVVLDDAQVKPSCVNFSSGTWKSFFLPFSFFNTSYVFVVFCLPVRLKCIISS